PVALLARSRFLYDLALVDQLQPLKGVAANCFGLNTYRFWRVELQNIAHRPSIHGQAQERAVGHEVAPCSQGLQPALDRQLALHARIDTREIVKKPVGPRTDR